MLSRLKNVNSWKLAQFEKGHDAKILARIRSQALDGGHVEIFAFERPPRSTAYSQWNHYIRVEIVDRAEKIQQHFSEHSPEYPQLYEFLEETTARLLAKENEEIGRWFSQAG